MEIPTFVIERIDGWVEQLCVSYGILEGIYMGLYNKNKPWADRQFPNNSEEERVDFTHRWCVRRMSDMVFRYDQLGQMWVMGLQGL